MARSRRRLALRMMVSTEVEDEREAQEHFTLRIRTEINCHETQSDLDRTD